MTITVTDIDQGPFTATGLAQTVAYTFMTLTDEEISVFYDAGAGRVLIDPAAHTVTRNKNVDGSAKEGGSVELSLAAAPAGSSIYLRANPRSDRDLVWSDTGSRLKNLNEEQDRQVLRALVIKDKLDRNTDGMAEAGADAGAAAGAAAAGLVVGDKLDKDGGGMQSGFEGVAKNFNIIVRNTPFGFGATGSDPVSSGAAINQMIADGIQTIYVPESLVLPDMALDGVTLELAQGAELVRDPASVGNRFLVATNVGGFRLFGGVINGQGDVTATAHSLLSLDGCWDYEIDGVRLFSPKTVAGSWGGGITISDSKDGLNETLSAIRNVKLDGTDSSGTFAVQMIRTSQVSVSGIRAKGFSNGSVFVNDPTVPVPTTVKNAHIHISDVMDIGCGGGVTIYGSRTGVVGGVDTLGQNVISAFINLSDLTSINPATYGLVAQGAGINAVNVTVKDGGQPGDLLGGILWQADSGGLVNAVVENPSGIGIDAGGARNTHINGFTVRGGGQIGLNLGASQGARASNGLIDGPPMCILASGWDGADDENWFPYLGRDLHLESIDCYVRSAGGRAVKLLNGFESATLRDVRSHVSEASELGKSFELGGCSRWRAMGCTETNETNASPAAWTDDVVLASATTVVVPDHTDGVTITGTTQIDFLRTQGQADYIGAVHSVVNSALGADYTDATTAAVTGGTGCIVTPVKSAGKVYGAYVVNKGSGFSSGSITYTDPGGGSGAGGVVNVGPANISHKDVLLSFQDATTIGSFAGNIFLSAGFTASALGISTLPLIFNFNSVVENGR